MHKTFNWILIIILLLMARHAYRQGCVVDIQREVIARQGIMIDRLEEAVKQQDSINGSLQELLEARWTREVTVTAYTARVEECNEDPEHTAFMMEPVPGRTVAVSRDLLEDGWTPGKSIYVPGHGIRIIQDVMNARYMNRIDVLMGTVEEAQQVAPSVKRVCLIM